MTSRWFTVVCKSQRAEVDADLWISWYCSRITKENWWWYAEVAERCREGYVLSYGVGWWLDDDDDKKKKQVVQKRPRQKNYASMLSGDFTSRDDYDYADEYGSEYASAALDDDVSATVSMPHTPHHHGHHGHATREAVVAADVEPRPYEFCCHKDTGEDMIGCDNDNCAHGGWFHFSCVGLTYKPEGDWYCPGCASTLKKKKRSTY